jgi:hypothetical protein
MHITARTGCALFSSVERALSPVGPHRGLPQRVSFGLIVSLRGCVLGTESVCSRESFSIVEMLREAGLGGFAGVGVDASLMVWMKPRTFRLNSTKSSTCRILISLGKDE